MKEVTRSNFEAMLPEIKEAIRNASFIAIDAEFTGLKVGTSDNFSLFDSLDDRYKKLKIRASSFIMNQIGLSAFTRHQTKNCYEVRTYVFYIRPYLCGDIDRRFMCQASCIDFLCRYDFDFNKVFKEGIPYINEVEEKELLKGIDTGSIDFSYKFLSREDDILLNETLFEPLKAINCPPQQKKHFLDKNLKCELEKDKLYPAYFQIIEIKSKYPTLYAYEEEEKIIVKHSYDKLKEPDLVAEKEKAVNYFLGFTKIFRLLKDSKKPIVGHNLLMDILLFIHNFHQPLPDTIHEFKKTVHSVFPKIYDTKYVWKNIRKHCNIKGTPMLLGLFELYEMFKCPPSRLTTLFLPSFEFCNGNKYAEGEFRHESGYDSYATGWVFINICHLIAMKNAKDPIFIEPQTFKQHLNAVTPFVNRVIVARCRYNHVNFDGDDPLPTVPEYLHIRKKTNESLTEAELSSILGKYGVIDLKLMNQKKQAIAAIGSMGLYKEILKDFKDNPKWDIAQYNLLEHSPYLRATLWATALGSVCGIAFLLLKLT